MIFDGFKWISGDSECPSPVIERRFTAKKPSAALLYVTACGFFEVRVNGREITEYRFLPVLTDFEPRDLGAFHYPLKDTTKSRLYYYGFDISEYILDGENFLEIQLANGWYKQTERRAEGNMAFGDTLKAIYKIELECGTERVVFGSDGSETWRDSEVRYSELFVGETVDMTAPLGEPSPVIVRNAPKTLLCKAVGAPDRVMRSVVPRELTRKGKRRIYDVGENISGVVKITTSAPYGERIILRFSEALDENGELDFHSTGAKYTCTSGCKQIMTDEFITDGETREFEPKFVWHAFRYFEVEGDIDGALVNVIHADVKATAEFSSSSEGLNFLFDAYLRTQLNNFHSSLPSDCPHRERLGYTGDGQICAPAAMMLTDSRELYEKWIQDILDCQDEKTGHVQHTAPLMGGGGGPGGWGSAIVFVPYAFYRQYGDVSMLEKCYEPMKKWLSYLCAHSENGLVTREEEGGWCLGDWCTREKVEIPEAYVNTCYFIKDILVVERIARILGREEDMERYTAMRREAEDAVVRTYRDKDGVSFADGVQGADAYAVWCGLGDARTAERLAEKYRALGSFDTGFLGTDILLEVLFEYGYADVVLGLLESEELGSFLYMKRRGATTIWEDWGGTHSLDHPMFGACVRQMFTSILGIKQPEDGCGYKTVRISPILPAGLQSVSGSIMTPLGRISVAVEARDGKMYVTTDIPDGIAVIE